MGSNRIGTTDPRKSDALLIEMGIGWKRDPKKPGNLTSANDSDYVREIERLRAEIDRLTAAKSGVGITDEMVAVPKSALDWLYGAGADANGEWFDTTQQRIERAAMGRGYGPGMFWWRSHFRKLIEDASPPPTSDGGVE